MSASMVPDDIEKAGQALLALQGAGRTDLARTLGQLVTAVAEEAARSSRFANALERAVTSSPANAGPASRRSGRRAAGPFDPFAVYNETGEDGLRERLGALDLEQLRDIVAEHGMDHDRLAMKWKDAARVIDRIVERVAARSAKGSAFRSSNR